MRYENKNPKLIKRSAIITLIIVFILLFPISILLTVHNPSIYIGYFLIGISIFSLLSIIPIIIVFNKSSIKYVNLYDDNIQIFINDSKNWIINFNEIQSIRERRKGFYEIITNIDFKKGVIHSGDLDDRIMEMIIEKNKEKLVGYTKSRLDNSS